MRGQGSTILINTSRHVAAGRPVSAMDGLFGLMHWEQIRAQMETSANPDPRGDGRDTPRRMARGRNPPPEPTEDRIKRLEREMKELQRRVAEQDSLGEILRDQLHVSDSLVNLLQQKSVENQRLAMELDEMRARQEEMEGESRGDNSSLRHDVAHTSITRLKTTVKPTPSDDSFNRLKKDVNLKVTAEEKFLAVLRHLFGKEMENVQFEEDKDVDPIPDVIMEFCFLIEQAVGTKGKDFARQLGLDPEEVESLFQRRSLGLKDQFWKVIAFWRRKQKSYVALSHLVVACQICDVSVGKGIGPMPREDAIFLQQHLTLLLEQVTLEPLLVELIQCQGFSRCAHLYVQGSSGTAGKEPHTEQVLRLLDVLPMMGDKALINLYDCLDLSKQGHVRQQLENAYGQRDDGGYASMSLTVSRGIPIPTPSLRGAEKLERRATH